MTLLRHRTDAACAASLRWNGLTAIYCSRVGLETKKLEIIDVPELVQVFEEMYESDTQTLEDSCSFSNVKIC